MQRSIEKELHKWKTEPLRMPLLIRGARQVGKSFTVEKFGRENFVYSSTPKQSLPILTLPFYLVSQLPRLCNL